MNTRAGFIQGIDGLIGKSTVGYIPFCQLHACLQRLVGITDVVMFFVPLFNVPEDLQGLFGGGSVNDYFLKTTFQCPVFLNVFTIFV
ncbi:hypothetical protein SDC9_195261 [bioreactor metagenome]|uniref:Uncharacterized protein n=1 Tax=bioreactor metagenome TaxID=1076179 RepID=A0A645I8I3_9ZZZZ